MKISIVIVTYNSKGLIDRCLRPFLSCKSSEVQIVIWDNNSPDGTFTYIKEQYPQFKLCGGTDNRGFAAGNNAAFPHCTGDYILLLNPDAFLETFEQVTTLAFYLANCPDVAAVGPMLLNHDGTHQVGDAGWEHRLTNVAGHFFFLHRVTPIFKSIYLTNSNLLAADAVDVDWICGACMLVRHDVIREVGGLDEEIFMYGEDVEWADRMCRHGYRLLYVPKVKVLHMQGGTQKDNKNTLFVSKKWIDALSKQISSSSPRWKFIAFKIILIFGFVLRMVIYAVIDIFRGSRTFDRARAMYDYVAYSLTLK